MAAVPTLSQTGMTLMEMLVVLAIIGVAAGAVSIGIGAGSRDSGVQAEAVRLAGRLQLAADQAMVDDRPVALVWDRGRYAFSTQDHAGRRTAPPSELLDLHKLPDGITLAVEPRSPVVPVVAGDRDGRLNARLTEGARSWTISYDGMIVSAAETVPR